MQILIFILAEVAFGRLHSSTEGHIMIKLVNRSVEGKVIKIEKGKAFAQGIFTCFGITEDDAVTDLRDGGFGSTDKKGDQ